MPRIYFFEKIDNFRDVGGYEVPYGFTSENVLFRCATPAQATQNDLDKCARIGIKTVLDLREDARKESDPSPFKADPRFVVIDKAVEGHGRVPKDYEDGLASYFEILSPESPYTAEVFRAILNAPKPLLIHCNAGKDRTGMFVFLLLLANGVRFEDANADYMASYPYLEHATKELVRKIPDFPAVCLTPNVFFLRDFYDRFLKKYGTIAGYLSKTGLNEEEIAGLCSLFKPQSK